MLRHCVRTLAESTPTKPNRPDRSPDNGVVMALNNDQRKATPPTRTSFETDMTRNSGLVKWRWRKVSVSISPAQSYSLPSSLLEDDLLGVPVADPGCHAMLPCESRSHNGSREMSAARHPACASLVFSVYNKGADSGEVGSKNNVSPSSAHVHRCLPCLYLFFFIFWKYLNWSHIEIEYC